MTKHPLFGKENSLKLQPQNVSTFEDCNSAHASGQSNKSVSQETEVKISGDISAADFKRSPQYTAPRLAGIGTFILWWIFLILILFLPINKKPKFKTVQIVLETTPIQDPEKIEISDKTKTQVAKTTSDPTPVKQTPEITKTETVQNTPAPVKESTAPVETKKAESQATTKKSETKKSPTTKKTETKKTETAPAKTETPKTESYTKAPEYQIKKSVEEQMAELAEARQANSKSTDYDPWAQFDDVPTEKSSETKNVQKQIDNKSALSGSAGSAAESKTSASTTSTSDSFSSQEIAAASSSTTSSLGKIAATTYTSKSSDGTSESVALVKSSKSSTGKVAVAMDDGSSRGLIYPSNPSINISDENAKLIDSTKTVTISFRVLNSGNVPRSAISISPSNILPAAVQNEILGQISEWRFDASDYASTAQFEFTILIK